VAETAPPAAPSPACKFNRLALRAEPATHRSADHPESFPRWDQINASKHARATGHPVIASAQPGERWLYCYLDAAFAEY